MTAELPEQAVACRAPAGASGDLRRDVCRMGSPGGTVCSDDDLGHHGDEAMFRTAGDVYRGFSRFAAVAFFLVAIYTLLVKVPGGDIRDDWSHTVLHVATGLFAVYAGWIAAGETAAVAFAWALALGYGGLGVVGWFVDGFLMNTTLRVPLGAADNVFHLFLGAGAIVAIAVAWARTERPRAEAGLR
jgi:hypothetical protein